ncbi:hypothetical protein [Paramuribaculum intestinale]|uniref:hypothetical protein n=1 Tax=Paramuribaculum intestinale TaxID=2094151 RepID=UPI000FFE9306|nr:hypothetical protein [Paramuribaculum intestinale]RXE63238.1 hypothetical protein ED375_01825 [Muribaculaceae bacterium Isolate-004 (NCI)]
MPTTHRPKDQTLSPRDRDFIAACRTVIESARGGSLTAAEIALKASRMPAPSYYLSHEQAMRHLHRPTVSSRRRRREHPSTASRREEIERKVALLQQKRGIGRGEALAHVLAGGASGFFIEPSTALRLYQRIRQRRRSLRRTEPIT